MGDAGKMFVVLGGVILLIGLVMMFAGRFNFPLGRLPGDVTWRGKNTVVYFPIVTSILVSIGLSVVMYLSSHFRR